MASSLSEVTELAAGSAANTASRQVVLEDISGGYDRASIKSHGRGNGGMVVSKHAPPAQNRSRPPSHLPVPASSFVKHSTLSSSIMDCNGPSLACFHAPSMFQQPSYLGTAVFNDEWQTQKSSGGSSSKRQRGTELSCCTVPSFTPWRIAVPHSPPSRSQCCPRPGSRRRDD